MPAFKDFKGREWHVDIDVFGLRDVRELLKVDLCSKDIFVELQNDLVKTANVLWVLCRGQHDGVTDEDFGRSLRGDAIAKATDALIDAIVLFARPEQRSLLKKMLVKQAEAREKGTELVLAKIDDPRVMEAMQQEIEAATEDLVGKARARLRNTLALSSPESSASIPAGSD